MCVQFFKLFLFLIFTKLKQIFFNSIGTIFFHTSCVFFFFFSFFFMCASIIIIVVYTL